MNKKVIISLVLIAVMAFGTALGTYAYFTSQATSNNNVFTAGTIDLNVNGDTNGVFDIVLNNGGFVQPGDVLTGGDSGIATIIIKNAGNLPMATFGRFTLKDDNGLADDMLITGYKVEFFNRDDQPTTRPVDNFIYTNEQGQVVKFNAQFASNMRAWVDGYGPLDTPATAWDHEALKPGQYIKISFKLQYDTAAQDQGKTCKLGYEVKATQVNADAIKELNLQGIPGVNGGDSYFTTLYNDLLHQMTY